MDDLFFREDPDSLIAGEIELTNLIEEKLEMESKQEVLRQIQEDIDR